MTIITKIINHDLCIDYSICAALCPQDVLGIEWNRYGEYSPVEVTSCTTECSLYLKICPFADSGENGDTFGERLYGEVFRIQHRSETDYSLASHVGYSEEHRLTNASGGIAIWLLETLLAEDIADYVICVTPTGDSEKLFAFQVFDTVESVRAGAGSAYYPVEVSGIVRHILEVPGGYAVVSLPYFVKTIRLSQQRNRKLLERNVVTVGLDDHEFMQRAFSLIKSRNENVVLVSPECSVAETKWIIRQMTLFAGARTPSTIATLSTGIPTLSFAYSIKAQGINQGIFNHTDYCMEPTDLDAGAVAGRVTAMLNDGVAIRNDLAGKIPGVQRAALSARPGLKRIIGVN